MYPFMNFLEYLWSELIKVRKFYFFDARAITVIATTIFLFLFVFSVIHKNPKKRQRRINRKFFSKLNSGFTSWAELKRLIRDGAKYKDFSMESELLLKFCLKNLAYETEPEKSEIGEIIETVKIEFFRWEKILYELCRSSSDETFNFMLEMIYPINDEKFCKTIHDPEFCSYFMNQILSVRPSFSETQMAKLMGEEILAEISSKLITVLRYLHEEKNEKVKDKPYLEKFSILLEKFKNEKNSGIKSSKYFDENDIEEIEYPEDDPEEEIPELELVEDL